MHFIGTRRDFSNRMSEGESESACGKERAVLMVRWRSSTIERWKGEKKVNGFAVLAK
jgi:hypothetical protein